MFRAEENPVEVIPLKTKEGPGIKKNSQLLLLRSNFQCLKWPPIIIQVLKLLLWSHGQTLVDVQV